MEFTLDGSEFDGCVLIRKWCKVKTHQTAGVYMYHLYVTNSENGERRLVLRHLLGNCAKRVAKTLSGGGDFLSENLDEISFART